MIPVFIGGCDRSGTTLLGSMLGAHSDCLTIPESQFKTDIFKSFQGNINLLQAFNLVKNHWRFKIWELNLGSIPMPKESPWNSYSNLLEWIIIKYGESVGKTSFNTWIDHTPSNIKNANILLELFPQGKMIHIIRDGRAVALSVMKLEWGPNTVLKAAPWWVENVAYGLASESVLEKDKILRVKYEDLITDPEKTLKKVCNFINIEYQSDMIKGNGFKVPRYSHGQHTLVGKKPDAKRMNAWEKGLTSRQIEIFEGLTGNFLQNLGYDLKCGLKARGITKMERLLSHIYEWYRWVPNRYRYYYRIMRAGILLR